MSKFDWKTIAGPLIKAGMGTLGGVLGGPAGAAIGGAVGPVIAEALGVPAEPDAVAEAIESNPAGAAEAIRNREAEIAELTMRHQSQMLSVLNETYRLEMKSDSWIARNWRPLHGVEFTLECVALAGVIVRALVIGGPVGTATVNNIMTLMPFWMLWFGLRGGILAVHVYQRSEEKKVQTLTNSAPDLLAEVIGTAMRKATKK